MMKIWEKRCIQPKMGFVVKLIFQREMVKVWKKAVLKPKWSKTQFLRNSVIARADLMQNAFFGEKWWKFGKTMFSTQNGAKHSLSCIP